MRCYRLCRAPFRALDGEGARLHGGRWNTPGRPAVYASGSLALAALEYLVHLDASEAPTDLVALALQLPDSSRIETVNIAALPADWMRYADATECKAVGDAWLAEGRAVALRVPSSPVPEEWNLLINPRHPDAAGMALVAERPFVFDPRLFR